VKILSEEEFEEKNREYEELPTEKQIEVNAELKGIPIIKEAEITGNLELFDKPVEMQKELASKIKSFVDNKIAAELKETGFLTDFTRRWVKDYNEILDKLHKNIYGDKSLNLHLHKVSHAQIRGMINKYKDLEEDKFDEETIDIEGKE